MTSAADKVFNIQELLEHILLYLGNDDADQDSFQSKELFKLQRVCRGSVATIQASSKLCRRMGTVYKLDADITKGDANDALAPYLKRHELIVAPFQYQKAGLKAGCLSLTYKVDAADLELVRKVEVFEAGIQSPGKQTSSSKHHSWRSMKLSTKSMPATVNIYVYVESRCFCYPPGFIQLSLMHGTAPRNYCYKDWQLFDPGEGTLGDVIDMLEEVALRSPREHMLLAQQKRDVESVVGIIYLILIAGLTFWLFGVRVEFVSFGVMLAVLMVLYL